jgi:hypothetical protein
MYWLCSSGDRLHDFAVDVSDTMKTAVNDPASTRCASYTGVASDGEIIVLDCALPTRGRWLKLQIIAATGVLSLCEVEVYGIISN